MVLAALTTTACASEPGEPGAKGLALEADQPPYPERGAQAQPPPVPAVVSSCHAPLASNGAQPPPLPRYAGTCPAIGSAATQAFTFKSSSRDRSFLVVRPDDARIEEVLPIVFVWHWLSGSAEIASLAFDLPAATKKFRFVAVIPESAGDEWEWPFDVTTSNDRVEEEAVFFDDMLSCVHERMPNTALHCVSTVGVSAGALYAAQLVASRSQRLSSFVSLSGGVGGLARGLSPNPSRALPSLVLWGGDKDNYHDMFDFAASSRRLEDELKASAVVECVHDCGHAVPPFEASASRLKFEPAFQFVVNHPYGLPAGESPYARSLPPSFPSWCAYGAGKAQPRTSGACGEGSSGGL